MHADERGERFVAALEREQARFRLDCAEQFRQAGPQRRVRPVDLDRRADETADVLERNVVDGMSERCVGEPLVGVRGQTAKRAREEEREDREGDQINEDGTTAPHCHRGLQRQTVTLGDVTEKTLGTSELAGVLPVATF